MWLYFLLALPPMLLGLYAQNRVKRNFAKYSQVRTARNIRGVDVARQLLDAEGLHNVDIEESKGFLSDHYDPRHKVLRLSPDVYNAPSIAAAGVAAHEMGHAMQDKASYFPLRIRSALVPGVQFGSQLGPMVLFGGLIMSRFTETLGTNVAILGLILFGLTAVFALITLPVEFNATRRAKKLLVTQGILVGDEIEGVNKVLDAAALTYVAAAISTVMTVLYYAMILFGGRRR